MARNRAFTLIELLVVLAIIVLLFTILGPTLQEVRQVGRRVVCQSNLHQRGVAFATYVTHNDQYFPIEYNAQWLDVAGRPTTEPRPLNDFLGTYEVSHCPSDMGRTYAYPAYGPPSQYQDSLWESFGSSYFTAVVRPAYGIGHVCAFDWPSWGLPGFWDSATYRPMKVGDFHGKTALWQGNPTNKVITGDGPLFPSNPARFPNNLWHSKDPVKRHNILFADWHVEFFRFPPAYENTDYWDWMLDPTRGWW